MPGCFFQPCFKTHDSSFQSVMNRRWCHSRMHGTRTLHVQESCTIPCLGESGRSRARARDRYHGIILTMDVPQTQLPTPRWTFLFGNRDRYHGFSGSRQGRYLRLSSLIVWRTPLCSNRDRYHGVSRQWRCLSFFSSTVWRTLLSGTRDRSRFASSANHPWTLRRECVGVDRGVGSAS